MEDLDKELVIADKATLDKYRSPHDPNLYRVSTADLDTEEKKHNEDPLKDIKLRLSKAEEDREALQANLLAEKKRNEELDKIRSTHDKLADELNKTTHELNNAKYNEIDHAIIVLQNKSEVESINAQKALDKYKSARSNNDYELEVEALDELNYSKALLGQYKTDFDTLEYHQKQSKNNNYQQETIETQQQRQSGIVEQNINNNTDQNSGSGYYSTPELFEEGLKLIEPKIANWAKSHMDDLLIPERQKLAFDVDSMAVQVRGYIPGSKQYLAYMDENLGYNSHNDDEPGTTSGSATPKNVRRRDREGGTVDYSAPPSKMSSTSSSTTIILDENQLEAAQAANKSPEEWMKYVKAAQSAIKDSNRNGYGIYKV